MLTKDFDLWPKSDLRLLHCRCIQPINFHFWSFEKSMWSEWDLSWAPTEIILVSIVSRPSFLFGARAAIHWSTHPRWSGGLGYGTGLENGTEKSVFSIISLLPIHTRGKGAFQFGDGSFLCSYHECDWSLQTQPGEVVFNRPTRQRLSLPHYCRTADLL